VPRPSPDRHGLPYFVGLFLCSCVNLHASTLFLRRGLGSKRGSKAQGRARRVVAEVDNVTRPYLQIDRKRRRRCWRDVSEAQNKRTGAVAGDLGIAVEQIDLGGAGVRRCDCQVPQDPLAQVSATCGVLKARERLSRASPTFAAASQIFLHSPDTMTSIAARTLAEMRRGGSAFAGAGVSSTASARLAGVPGGVMFSIFATVCASRQFATYQNVTYARTAYRGMPSP
jgi:hypothetical protein